MCNESKENNISDKNIVAPSSSSDFPMKLIGLVMLGFICPDKSMLTSW